MIKIYNSLTRRKELLTKKSINFFVCGPTVYNHIHLGNAKTYLQFDLIVKYLRFRKFKVNYIQNITDIDDKIINRAKELGIGTKEVADKFYEFYLTAIKNLDINSVNKYVKATGHIPEIISQISQLLKKGYAYSTVDGIYFDLSKDKDYGKLSGRTYLQAEDSTSRIDVSKEKRNKGDFCLWKFSKQNEPFWQSPFGKPGRPGWHVEDTAITEKYFGAQYDIHGGGIDLMFPHHEAEIAQMESISNKKPFVKIWMHTGFLDFNKEKMSKSKGNILTLNEILKKYDKFILRFFFTSSHYRSRINFSEELLEQAKNGLERIQSFYNNLKYLENNKSDVKVKKKLDTFRIKFLNYMDDDFNTPEAYAVIFNMISYFNNRKLTLKDAKLIIKFLKEVNQFLGIIKTEDIKIPKEILKLVKLREHKRKLGNYKEADNIRDKIRKKGFKVEDSESGPRLIEV